MEQDIKKYRDMVAVVLMSAGTSAFAPLLIPMEIILFVKQEKSLLILSILSYVVFSIFMQSFNIILFFAFCSMAVYKLKNMWAFIPMLALILIAAFLPIAAPVSVILFIVGISLFAVSPISEIILNRKQGVKFSNERVEKQIREIEEKQVNFAEEYLNKKW